MNRFAQWPVWRAAVCGYWVILAIAPALAEVDFNRDIRPILSGNCYRCHGPDEKKRAGGSRGSGGLRLDTFAGATATHGGYTALVPGQPEESELLYRVESEDEAVRMPPAGAGRHLTGQEIARLRQWIKEGGTYAVHWSYRGLERPDPPPTGEGGGRVHNPIDAFVIDRLRKEGMMMAPEADRMTVARRVALDLTGLPPGLEEVEAFVADPDRGAYERYVDRQLAKPAYGEHWARFWLDLARYADSAGYADDPLRTIWAYRDYVIGAFNENVPFDRFTVEQIAGDLLPNPSDDQLVATAFHRNTKTNSEGGTNDEEFRNEAIVDRVNTTMAVWMGTTIDCAQCHTHKYDPITQEEYFGLFAIFNQTADEDRTDEEPVWGLYQEEQKAQIAELRHESLAILNRIRNRLAQPGESDRRYVWERRLLAGSGWGVIRPAEGEMKADSEATLTCDERGIITVGANSAPRDFFTVAVELSPARGPLTAVRLEVFGQPEPWVLNELELRRFEPDTNQKSVQSDGEDKSDTPRPVTLKFKGASASFEQEWYGVARLMDGNKDDRLSGWGVGGRESERHEAVLELESPVDLSNAGKLEFTLHLNFPNKKIRRFRLSVSNEIDAVPALPLHLVSALTKRPSLRSSAEEAALMDFYAWHDPQAREERTRLVAIQRELELMRPRTTVPVLQELPQNRRRPTPVQYRGSFRDLGPEVSPGVPAVFPPLPEDAPVDRLGLARWLVSCDNPLTARVTVNRFWESLFGIGLVATSEDFGSQGEPPSHPDLLDWLAVEFRESGWDMKRLLRLMVTSATYQQSSKVTPDNYERDPNNRWLSRGPRIRISAETVRDQALAVSGLLDTTLYGPSVRPPQPELGLTAAFGSKTDWETSDGGNRYRRGLYTSWRRSSPYPSMVAFDAPSREVCTVRRKNTNTPLQAFVTLNDPVYVEAAQALGRGMMSAPGDQEAKIAWGFRRCLIRPPSGEEVRVLTGLFEAARARYAERLEEANKMATDPLGVLPEGLDVAEAAAWTLVANTLLNLDEMFLKP